MADIDYDDYGSGMSDGRSAQGRGQAILNMSGAVISLSLLLGLGYWGYSIAVRDVSGIPVLRAMSEPMRISPVDPGGDSASHQGLTVNAVVEVGAVSELPNQLVLAPAPMALTEEDAPGMGALVSTEASMLAGTEVDINALVETAKSAVDLLEPVELAAVEAVDMDQAQSEAVAAALAQALGEEVAVGDTGGGLFLSPRPKARAARVADDSELTLVEPAEIQSLSASEGDAIREIAASDIPVGTRLVQLGAFDDGDAARREWKRLSGQFSDLMADKSMVVQEAQSGGRGFFRLRAHGFEDEDQARRFCAAILAEGASCIPVAQR